MAEAERHGRVSLAIFIEQPILDSIEEYAITVACPQCHRLSSRMDGYTWRYSNNLNFLQEVELMKLLNCSHHLSTSTEAVLNISLKSTPRKSARAGVTLDRTGIWQTISR